MITGQPARGGHDISHQKPAAVAAALWKAKEREREEPELVLEASAPPASSHGRKHSIRCALVYLPDVAAGPPRNANYTGVLLGVNSSPRLGPPSSLHLLLFLRETAGPGHKHPRREAPRPGGGIQARCSFIATYLKELITYGR